MFIDIHTHNENINPNIIAIQCWDTIPSFPINFTHLVSIGIHPWFATKNEIDFLYENLKTSANNNNILAIGECGLDKLRGPDLKTQIEIFSIQAQLANELGKPIIIHCVKAFDELMKLHESVKPSTPWIIHGFQKNWKLAKQLINMGLRLSFGSHILQNTASLNEVLENIDLQMLFLETDNNNQISVIELYTYLSELRGIAENELKNIIRGNFERDFEKAIH
jgi:TatD DNase family protein